MSVEGLLLDGVRGYETMNMSSVLIKGLLFVLLSSTADATIPIIGKAALLYNLSPPQVFFLRHFMAFIVFVPICVFQRKPIVYLSPLVILQGLILFIQELLFYFSLQYLQASIATIIFYSYPIIVAVLAIFIFREKAPRRFYIGLVIAFLGICIMTGVFSGTSFISIKGLILVAISSFLFAIFSLLGQKTKAEPLQLIGTSSLICVIICGLIYPQTVIALPTYTLEQLGLGLASGVLNNLVGLVCFLQAIEYIGASRASLGCTLEPVIAVTLAVILLHEPVTLRELTGMVMVISSVVLSLSLPGYNKNAA